MNTDTIADYLTRVRNASMAGHKVVDIPSSNIKKDITKILFDNGIICSLRNGFIRISLAHYNDQTDIDKLLSVLDKL